MESKSDTTDDFPSLGLRLSYVLKFVQDNENMLKNKTTTEVLDKIILPTTTSKSCSYCEYIKDINPDAVTEAKVFISHAWKYKFLDVIDALSTHFTDDLDIPIWFDLFSNNQHTSPARTFEWWSNTFLSAIEQFNHTVMVLAPWDDPIPLKRGWCIWELFCSIQTGCLFEIAMSSVSEKQFIQDVDSDPNGVVDGMLGTINCEKSECFKIEDKTAIHEAIKRSIGFSEMNKSFLNQSGSG